MQYFVYMMASEWRTLYIGMTSDIGTRIHAHKNGTASVFTRRYRCNRLVYIEQQQDRISAQARELELKGWKRYRKLALIDAVNPEWKDLSALWPAMLR